MSTQEQKALAPTLRAGNAAVGIIPTTFDDCYRMAKLLSASGLVPDQFKDKPEATCVAIMQGLEVGLAPMAALQSIAVINGRPSLWGDGALAVVRASGLMEYIKEWTEDTIAYCEIKRSGEPALIRTFSDADAKTAGLLGKKGPWQEYRPRMRQMRARSWAMRDGFADVMKGLHIVEEARDIPIRDITPAKPAVLDVPDDIDQTSKKQTEAESPQIEHEPLADAKSYLAKLKEDLDSAGDLGLINETWNANADIVENRLSRTDRAVAEGYLETALAKVDDR